MILSTMKNIKKIRGFGKIRRVRDCNEGRPNFEQSEPYRYLGGICENTFALRRDQLLELI